MFTEEAIIKRKILLASSGGDKEIGLVINNDTRRSRPPFTIWASERRDAWDAGKDAYNVVFSDSWMRTGHLNSLGYRLNERWKIRKIKAIFEGTLERIPDEDHEDEFIKWCEHHGVDYLGPTSRRGWWYAENTYIRGAEYLFTVEATGDRILLHEGDCYQFHEGGG